MKNIAFTTLLAAVLAGGFLFFAAPKPAYSGIDGPMYTIQRSAAVSVTNSSTVVAATSTSRR